MIVTTLSPCIVQKRRVHWRRPMVVMRQGRLTSLFQALQLGATMLSCDVKTRSENQLSRINFQTFSTGFSSGAVAGSAARLTLKGAFSLALISHPARSSCALPCALGATASARPATCRVTALMLQKVGPGRRLFPQRADSAEDVGRLGALVVGVQRAVRRVWPSGEPRERVALTSAISAAKPHFRKPPWSTLSAHGGGAGLLALRSPD